MTVHTEHRWSAETEQSVVVAVYRAECVTGAGYDAMPRPDGVFDPALRDARAALAYLADRGLLLPEGGETRELFRDFDTVSGGSFTAYSLERVEQFCAEQHKPDPFSPPPHPCRHEVRTVTEWSDGSTYTTPWEPVHVDA